MDAAHDYATATRFMHNTFPAYVGYVQRMHAKIGPIVKDEEDAVVVRTSDGKVVSGKNATVTIAPGEGFSGNIVLTSPFNPSCYAPVAETPETYDGAAADALQLRATCRHQKDDPDFTTLYIDPRTQEPLGVVGGTNDSDVRVRLEETFRRVGDRLLPAHFGVTVKGKSFWLGWLDVVAQIDYSRYRFLSRDS
jgi:hypothetical protein